MPCWHSRSILHLWHTHDAIIHIILLLRQLFTLTASLLTTSCYEDYAHQPQPPCHNWSSCTVGAPSVVHCSVARQYLAVCYTVLIVTLWVCMGVCGVWVGVGLWKRVCLDLHILPNVHAALCVLSMLHVRVVTTDGDQMFTFPAMIVICMCCLSVEYACHITAVTPNCKWTTIM